MVRILSPAVALALVAALAIQYTRGGWPFSREDEPAARAQRRDEHPGDMKAMADAEPPSRAPVDVDPGRLGGFGVTVEDARVERIAEPLRAVAVVTPDEARVARVHTRVAGWIEGLYVATTGESVRRGDPLVDIFSQQLLSSQDEYLVALESGSDAFRKGARQRLSVLGTTEAEIRKLKRRGVAARNVTLFAPRDGIVLHRGIAVGTAVDPSTEIITIADLSEVWVFAELPEPHVGAVSPGAVATIAFAPSRWVPFEARVDFVYPTITDLTRTLRVRFAVENPDGTLRPGTYGDATFHIAPRETLTVPRDALVDTGLEQHVFVVEAPGRFVPRAVTTGVRTKERVEIRAGLRAGEPVVASGVFLIDSESRLRASGQGGMAGMGHEHGAPSEREREGAPPRRPDEHGVGH